MCNDSAWRYTSVLKMAILAIAVEERRKFAGNDSLSGDEVELVRRIASSPPGHAADAEEQLYRRMAPRVRLYGLRHLRDDHAAADLAQEVLLIVIEALRAGRLREPERFVSFVLGTCRMVVLNIRRNAGRRQDLLDQFQADLPAIAYSPIPSVDRAQLERCMQSLPERERSVTVMSYFDEQTAQEIAGFLALSQANVRVIRHRALGRLRDCMSGRKGSQ